MERQDGPQDEYTSAAEQADLWGKVQKVRFAMLTTRAADGALSSRPMTLQEVEDEGTLWFFTSASTRSETKCAATRA